MGNLGYALTVLRLFDRRFYKSERSPSCVSFPLFLLLAPYAELRPFLTVGILYTASAGMIFVVAFFRQRHSRHDFADKYKNPAAYRDAIKTVGQTGKRVFGRPCVTAGWVVIGVTGVVLAVEIALFVLVLKIKPSP